MSIIAQEPTPKYSSKVFEKETKNTDFFDDFNSSSSMYNNLLKNDPDLASFETIEPIESRHSNISSMFSTPSSASTGSNARNTDASSSSSSRVLKTAGGTVYTTQDNDDAQKKFGGAKAISSDQFFSNEASSFERSANLAKFQGSTSISSADYFGDGSAKAGSNRG